MAWQISGGSINPGVTKWRTYWWSGQDQGAQVARIRPLNPGSNIIVLEEGAKLEPNGTTTYYMLYRNAGPYPVRYNVRGGAL